MEDRQNDLYIYAIIIQLRNQKNVILAILEFIYKYLVNKIVDLNKNVKCILNYGKLTYKFLVLVL